MIEIPLKDRTIDRLIRDRAAERADHPFLLFEGRRWSYAEMERATRRMALGLGALGVGPGDHVATLMGNSPELLFAYLALTRLGAVAVPVNTAARGELLVYFLDQSDSTLLLVDRPLADRFLDVQDRLPAIRALLLLDEAGDPALPGARMPVHDFRDLAAGPDEPLATAVRFTDLSHLSYTSGTTGPSKGNMATHAHTIAQGLAYANQFGYRTDDVLYSCLPLLHGNALLACVMPALVAGAAVALSRRFSASAFWDEVRAVGATQFNLLGAMANILWSQPERPSDRDNRVRQCMAVPVPTEFYHAFEQRYGLVFTSIYGLTDFGNVVFRGPDAPPEKWASAGRPLPWIDLRIVDEDDFELPPGTVGEVVLRSREPWYASAGYYAMPEQTWRAWRNLWFHSGDRGYLDEDGWFHFADRKKDAIRRRGQNISSYEVEQTLLRHPAVADVAAYAVKSEMSEDEVMVTVQLRDGATLTEAELVAFCQDNTAYYMVPRYVEFRPDLPRTASEKVQKYKLREEAEARLDQIWDREKAGIRVRR